MKSDEFVRACVCVYMCVCVREGETCWGRDGCLGWGGGGYVQKMFTIPAG